MAQKRDDGEKQADRSTQALEGVERAKTGIPGLDNLVEGGFPKNFNILVSGAPGTGKTIFGLQYLYNGALMGDPGLYVSLDASEGSVRTQANLFGWNIDRLERDGNFTILDVPMDMSRVNLFEIITEAAKDMKAKRIVFDSLSSFAINIDQFAIPLRPQEPLKLFVNRSKASKGKEEEYRYEVMAGMQKDAKGHEFYAGISERRITYLLINELSKLNTTNVVITGGSASEMSTIDGISEYVCDGLISLKSLAIGQTLSRTIEIKKMRFTNVNGGIYSYSLGSKGIAVQE